MSRRRPYPQGDDDDGYDRFCRSKRRRVSEDQEMEEHLETLIYRIGEKSTATLESNLEGLASVLEAYLNKYRPKVLRLLTDCAVKMPEKCTTYSTIAGLMNAKNYNFGGEFVEQMVKIFKDSLKSCSWDTARYTLRFLADLVNCHVVDASSLFKLLDHMLEVAKEDSENIPDVRKSWFIYAVLYCLPWVGRELYEKKEKQLEMLITTIEVLLNKRTKRHVPALRVWSIDVPHTQEEYLDCLWEQVRKLKQDNWQEKHIPRPYLAFDNVLCEALQHTLPVISIPPHSDSFVYPKPTVIFRMFDYTDCPERGPVLPGAHSIERFLIEEHLHQIIENYHLERKECAAHLIEFPYKAKIPLEYCIVEVIFSELFNLPQPRYLEVFYGSLLIELSKLLPTTMPQVLAQATEILFLRIETMNTACFDRLVSWFSYHLSNFQYRWSWEDWEECLKLDHEHPRPKFIKEVLLKTMRLSYHQRIRDIVPRSYDCVLPTRPEPFYKYTAEGSTSLPGNQIAQQLMAAIQRRCSPEDLLGILKELPNPLEGDENSEARYNPLKIDVFVQTLFFLGSKSFSHSFAAIGKFNQVFKLLADGEDAQLCVLKSIYELWRNHQQMMCVLIDKMLKIQLLDCSSVATWIFSKEMSHEFTKMYVWEILHLTINKMSKYVSRLTRELAETREKLARRGGGNGSSAEESDDSMGGRNDDKPTEEMVERMEERLEAAQSDQKNLFLIIIQRFIMILTEHFARCDTDNKEFDNYWYRWTMGRLQQVFLAHHEQLQQYSSTLESLLFTHDLDLHILDVFHQFIALNS